MPYARQSALKAIRALQAAGYEAYLAGGCVRDTLLKRKPKDYDVATSATPDAVQALLPDTRAIGKAFGVIQANIGGHQIEIATFRVDHNYKDGRRPSSVTFCSAREDAMRRDFTINSIFLDPITGMYLDYCGGLADIREGLLRCVGCPDDRFQEDYLRMMRAVRFAFTLNFRLEKKTASAIQRHSGLIANISSERIREELFRILTESRNPGWAVNSLCELGLLPHILPLTARSSSQNQLRIISRNLGAMRRREITPMLTLLLLRTGANPGQRVTLEALPSITSQTEKELLSLKCSRSQTSAVLKAQHLYWQLTLSRAPLPSPLLPELAAPYADTAISLLHATNKPCAESMGRLSRTVGKRLTRQLICGDDLKLIGVAPGPKMKELLDRARILQAEGIVTSKKQVLKLLRQS